MSTFSRLFACAVMYAAHISLIGPPAARAESITVEQWDLGVGVVSVWPDMGGAAFTTVVNPFNGQHSVSLPSDPQTVASAQYDISWLTDYAYGFFHIASQQQAHGSAASSITTSANGVIHVTTTEPLPLHIDASWTYNMPADFMMSRFSVRVRSDEYPSTVLFHQSYQPQTWPGDPWSGTLTIQGDVILPPGPTWIMSYNMQLEADAGPSFSANGSGYVNLTITPEVSTLALLAPLLFVVARRATRRRGASSP